jgi:quercetin dioxygenase-like cupin family protein
MALPHMRSVFLPLNPEVILTHAFEHLNYIIEGAGVVVMATGEEKPVKQGDFVLVLPGEKHQYKNNSASSPFVMICAVPKEYE